MFLYISLVLGGGRPSGPRAYPLLMPGEGFCKTIFILAYKNFKLYIFIN